MGSHKVGKFGFEFIIRSLIGNMILETLKSIQREHYYLPAARSGILQGYKALVASIVKTAPLIGKKELPGIPRLSGAVSEFISSLITLSPDRKGRFYELAQSFENELFKGEIMVKSDKYLVPEIYYKFMDTEIPLYRSSSAISELAPLFLYLKYYVEPGSVLIIEEPEAHLHPQNQLILAKLLVRLVRKGV